MSATRRLVLSGPAATREFAARLAPLLGAGDVIGLEGELGAGKTELGRALIRARAGAAIEVPSPTFTLVQRYVLPGLVLTHADLYRLTDQGELRELGLDEAIEEGALLVEWPERGGAWLPAERLTLHLAAGPAGEPLTRMLTIQAPGSWAARLAAVGL